MHVVKARGELEVQTHLFLNLGSIWRRLVQYTSGRLTPGKSFLLSIEQEAGGLQCWSGHRRKFPVLQRVLVFVAASPRDISIQREDV
jgi:hypothetical protein